MIKHVVCYTKATRFARILQELTAHSIRNFAFVFVSEMFDVIFFVGENAGARMNQSQEQNHTNSQIKS